MKKNIKALICAGVVFASLALAVPFIKGKATIHHEDTLAQRERAISNLRYHIMKTLQPSVENRRWMRVKASQYYSLRNHKGYIIDMDESVGLGMSFRDAIEEHIHYNISAVKMMMFRTSWYNERNGFKNDSRLSLRSSQRKESDIISPDIQILLVDLVGSIEGLYKNKSFEGVDPSAFIYDSKGKMNLEEEILFSIEYFKVYKEYWIDYFLNDDAHKYQPNKRKRLRYKYIF